MSLHKSDALDGSTDNSGDPTTRTEIPVIWTEEGRYLASNIDMVSIAGELCLKLIQIHLQQLPLGNHWSTQVVGGATTVMAKEKQQTTQACLQNNMHVAFSALGQPLMKGLTEIATSRPRDPIAYLAAYLYNYANRNKSRVGTQLSKAAPNVRKILQNVFMLLKHSPPQRRLTCLHLMAFAGEVYGAFDKYRVEGMFILLVKLVTVQ
ncbi:hypothetical protein PR048_000242 [Dryococelus australis]|uniref:Uncharacterized protein n=1 Tax=Dryococelus australis TaxID=614101 RepID=A0ABQ9IE37_9NEOP|nr:hypothetical protein PR048_000242 [Dryococelus australis]